jgi:radical SAM-linked protein
MNAQRLRFRYSLDAEAYHLGQRELVAAWQEACALAGLSLAPPHGRRPSSRLSLAVPLPRGVTSSCELIDIVFADAGPAEQALARLAPHLPPGIRLLSVEEVGSRSPSLQSQVRWAEYEARVDGIDAMALRRAISSILDAPTLPSEYRREKKVREYDLRPLILDLRLTDGASGCLVLVMRLRADPERMARPDQVAAALGLPPTAHIRRTHLSLEEVPPVLSAYRRASQREEY